MKAPTSIGLINCGKKGLAVSITGTNEAMAISKIYLPRKAGAVQYKHRYPNAEIVEEKEVILQDSTIDQVIICEPGTEDLHLVAELLQSGKKVPNRSTRVILLFPSLKDPLPALFPLKRSRNRCAHC